MGEDRQIFSFRSKDVSKTVGRALLGKKSMDYQREHLPIYPREYLRRPKRSPRRRPSDLQLKSTDVLSKDVSEDNLRGYLRTSYKIFIEEVYRFSGRRSLAPPQKKYLNRKSRDLICRFSQKPTYRSSSTDLLLPKWNCWYRILYLLIKEENLEIFCEIITLFLRRTDALLNFKGKIARCIGKRSTDLWDIFWYSENISISLYKNISRPRPSS